MYRLCLLLLFVTSCWAQDRGAAIFPESNRIAIWGNGVEVSGKRVADGFFARGGCVADWNGDGRTDLILHEISRGEGDGALGKMVALLAPAWRSETIDTGASFRDCIGIELFGRKGVLVTHRQMQLRFYERSNDGGRQYQEVYSIYTASAQSGLATRDIDGDGRPDLIHGNYWLRAPESFELGWRLFALNTWFDGPRTAMLRMAPVVLRGEMVMVEAESEASPARFAWFEKPADPRKEWGRHDIAIPGGLHRPQVLVAGGEGVVVVGEDNGTGSRLLRVDLATGAVKELGRSKGYLAAGPGGVPAVARR